jgi:fucose 4-O-acetylase-like acetyltransferase
MKKRQIEFDIAKGIAIYLVVLGHVLNQVAGLDVPLISFCHMPVFFFISGYFLSHSISSTDDFSSIVRKKAKSLLIPYLSWSAISLLANSIIGIHNQINTGTVYNFGNEAHDIFINARSVWFLIMLFFSSMVILLCAYICSKKPSVHFYPMAVVIWLVIAFTIPGGGQKKSSLSASLNGCFHLC